MGGISATPRHAAGPWAADGGHAVAAHHDAAEPGTGVVSVAFCLDEKLEAQAVVALQTLGDRTAARRPLNVLVLSEAPSPWFVAALEAMRRPGLDIRSVPVGVHFDDLLERDRVTRAMYMRLLLPAIAAPMDKILYLDVDTLVVTDIASLFDVDLRGTALAAVPDFGLLNSDLVSKSSSWLDYQGQLFNVRDYLDQVLDMRAGISGTYFNSGVMLLNLAYWRRHDIADAVLDVVRSQKGLCFPDQDALNRVIRGNYRSLDPRWNVAANCCGPQSLGWAARLSAAGRRWQAVRTLWQTDPRILHFSGRYKPWSADDPPTVYDGDWWMAAKRSSSWTRLASQHEALATTSQPSKIPQHLRATAEVS